jgi:cytidylate kinase
MTAGEVLHVPQLESIAIDGPAASGKSTLAERLAKALGFLYFDTGVMYRAVTLAALRSAIEIEDEALVSDLARGLTLDVQSPSKDDGRQYDVLMDGQDVTWDIRTPEVDANVSLVSSYSGVRKAMTLRQREIGMRGKIVMVGRDIGTVVLPEADIKLYLDASVEARAGRRFEESQQRGDVVILEKVLAGMKERDRFDSTRSLAPLRPADDAFVLDSTDLDIDQVEQAALEIIRSWSAGSSR